jgi:hypothetical protein
MTTMERPAPVRRRTRQVMVGGVAIGDGAPIVVQSMTNTDTADVAATAAHVRALADAGPRSRVTGAAAAAPPYRRSRRRSTDRVAWFRWSAISISTGHVSDRFPGMYRAPPPSTGSTPATSASESVTRSSR